MTSTTKTSSGPTTTTANQPVPTLYLNHLDLSINKLLLRQSLYALFTPYGRIIDIVASKGPNKRGQAFIVFSEQKEATSALRGLSGKEFFGRELRIEYAKTKSQATKRVEDPFGQTGAGRGEGQDERVNEAMGSTKQKLVYSNAQEEYEALEKERAEEEEGRGKRARVEGEEGGGSEQESAGDAGEEQGEAKRRKVDQGRQGDEDEDDEEMEMDEEEETVGPSQKGESNRFLVLLVFVLGMQPHGEVRRAT